MDSQKITNIILTINEWLGIFESNPRVSPTDKWSIKEFRDRLQSMRESMAKLKQYHENEQESVQKEALNSAIADSLRVQRLVEKFIDDCGTEEGHEEWPTILGDARDVTFATPPPGPLFFRKFFDNLAELSEILFDIQDGNSRRYDATLKYRYA